MNKVKRLLSVFVCCVFAFCLVVQTGCNIGSDNEPIEIQFWHTFTGKQEIFFNALVDTYNATEGEKRYVTVVSVYKTQEEIDEYFSRSFNSEETSAEYSEDLSDYPEISVMNNEIAYMAMCRSLLAYAEEYLTEDQLDKYNSDFLQEGQFTGSKQTYIFPLSKTADIVMINDGLWQRFDNGAKINSSQWKSWSGISQLAEQYYEWSGGKALIAIESVEDYIFAYSAQQLPAIIQAANKEIKINTNKETLRAIWDFYYGGVIKGHILQTGNICSALEKGDVVAYLGLPHDSSYFPDTYVSPVGVVSVLYLSAMQYPVISPTKNVVPQSGNGVCVFNSTDRVNSECYYFLNWFCTNENVIQFCVANNEISSYEQLYSMDVTKSYLKELSLLDYNKYNMLNVSVEQVVNGSTYAPTGFIGYNSFCEELTDSLTEKARIGRDTVIALMESGKAYEEAVLLVDTEENFEAWYRFVVDLAGKY